jgi:histidine triad (HIT) family protein
MDCLFCKIAAGEIPSTKVYDDDTVYAFNDIDPQAPVHILIIPKEHISSAAQIDEKNSAVVAHIFEVAASLAKEKGLEEGFRIVTNCGESAGQSVHHLHFHLMGGRNFAWPAG